MVETSSQAKMDSLLDELSRCLETQQKNNVEMSVAIIKEMRKVSSVVAKLRGLVNNSNDLFLPENCLSPILVLSQCIHTLREVYENCIGEDLDA